MMYSYGPPYMAEQKQDGQLEHTYNSYVMIRDVALKTCWRQWTMGRRGERGSGISVQAARHDDDDDDDFIDIFAIYALNLSYRSFCQKISVSFCSYQIRSNEKLEFRKALCNIFSAEAKFGILLYNNKQFYYKKRLFLILKDKHQKKKRETKTVNLLNMVAIFFNYCINTPSKWFACLPNKFFRHFIPFLFNSSLEQTNIWMGSCSCFVLWNVPYTVIKRVKVWAWKKLQ